MGPFLLGFDEECCGPSDGLMEYLGEGKRAAYRPLGLALLQQGASYNQGDCGPAVAVALDCKWKRRIHMNIPATLTAEKPPLNTAGQMIKPQHVKPATGMGMDTDLAEQKRMVYFHRVAAGVVQDDVEKPEYWANLTGRFRAGDRVEIVASDGSWEGQLSVRQVLKSGIVMEWYSKPKNFTPVYKLQGAKVGGEDEYNIQNVAGMYRILRKADGQMVIGDSYPDEPTARHALRQYLNVKAN